MGEEGSFGEEGELGVRVLDHRSVGRLNASHHRRTLIHNGNFWLGCRVDLREGINNKKKLSTFDG